MTSTHSIVHESLEAQHTKMYIGNLYSAVGFMARWSGRCAWSVANHAVETTSSLEIVFLDSEGNVWRGGERCGEVWRGVERRGEAWRGGERRGEEGRGGERREEVWRGVERRGEEGRGGKRHGEGWCQKGFRRHWNTDTSV